MSKNFIVISDIHFPYHDPKAINAVKRFIKAKPVDIVVFNGDILDMYDVSSFDKSPDRINSLQEELNMAMKLFGDIRKELPEAEMVYVEGNHEYRLKRYLMRHPELFSLEALQLPNLLRLDKFNIQYTDKPYYLGNLKVTHGSIVRKFAGYTAKAEMEKNDCSGISSHTHRGSAYYRQTPTRYLAWYESFCLCDIHPEYVVDPDWQQGFIFGKVNKDSFSVMPIPIVQGKLKSPLLEEI